MSIIREEWALSQVSSASGWNRLLVSRHHVRKHEAGEFVLSGFYYIPYGSYVSFQEMLVRNGASAVKRYTIMSPDMVGWMMRADLSVDAPVQAVFALSHNALGEIGVTERVSLNDDLGVQYPDFVDHPVHSLPVKVAQNLGIYGRARTIVNGAFVLDWAYEQ